MNTILLDVTNWEIPRFPTWGLSKVHHKWTLKEIHISVFKKNFHMEILKGSSGVLNEFHVGAVKVLQMELVCEILLH